MPKGFLVFCEQTEDGGFSPLNAELLGAARRLGDATGQLVSAAFIGAAVEPLAPEAIACGAERVLVAQDPALKDYLGEAYLPVAEQIVREVDPAVVLLGQTNLGRDLAPRLAFRLGTGVAMDTVELAAADGQVRFTRPCYGGNARAELSFRTTPAIATVRPKSQDPAQRDPSRQGEVTTVAVQGEPSALPSRLLERAKAPAEGVRLEDADVVISGGRGLGGPEAFKLLEEVAQLLTGAVGASRAVCDLGWYPVAHQVGLTGKVVSPTLYIAVAISGASQHMAGCSGAKNIVAINKDREATIFAASRFGVVGDWKPVLEGFRRRLAELKAG